MTRDPLPHPDPDADADALVERAGQLLAVLDGEDPREHLAVVDEALPLLRRAVALAPHHPDLALWYRATGWALAVRGDVSGDPADYATAVEWTRWAGAAGHPDLDRDDLALDLAHLLVLRHRARSAPEDPAAVEALLADLVSDGPPADDGTAVWAAFAVPRGLAHLAALDVGLGVEHLDRAHTLLAGAVDRLPDHAALLPDGLIALGRTGLLTDRLDPGLVAIHRARALDHDLDPVELDLMAVELLERRWDLHSDPADLDAVVALLHGARAARPGDRSLTCWLARWLAERGDHHDDADDLTAAITLSADPGREPLDDAAEQALAWFVLGLAHLARRRCTGADDGTNDDDADDDRDRGEAALAAVVDLDPADLGLLLDAHTHRLEALDDRVRRSPDPAVRERADAALHQLETALDRTALVIGQDRSASATALLADRAVAALAGAVLENDMLAVNGMQVDRLRRLADVAAEHPDPPEQWSTLLPAVRIALDVHDDTVAQQGGRTRELLTGIAQAPDHPELVGPALREMFGMSGVLDALWSGDLTRMAAAEHLLDEADPEQATMAAIARFLRALPRLTRVDELVAGLDDVITHCDRDGTGGSRLLAEMLRRLRTVAVPDPAVLDRPWPVPGPVARGGAGSAVHDVMATAPRVLDDMCRLSLLPDHAARRPMLVAIGDATDRAGRGPVRSSRMVLLTQWWLSRAEEAPRDPEALHEAVRWTDAALVDLPGPEHPLWGPTALTAARARRLRDGPGDRAESRRLGLEALRARTWAVLLQIDADDARTAARAAAGEALRVARWCAADRERPGAVDDLVAALEAGRGLVLHAALTTRGVAGRLADTGRAELAREWQEAGGDDLLEVRVPALRGSGLRGDLRRRVLDAVGGEGSGLLTPPDPAELRGALRAQGTDALVYLVAGDAAHCGLAVLVPESAPVEVLDLPGLRSGPDTPLARYTTAYARRDSDRSPEGRAAGQQEWRASLSELTTWAWTTAVADVLTAAAAIAADPARPRLALVPVGELALVPWHAAGSGGSTGGVLASRAVVSSTPSARMLCQALARPRTPEGGTLIVGDPTGDLVAARSEAQALRTAFYRDATYLGRGGRSLAPVGRGARGDVLDRLGAPHAVVHLACHAHAEPDDPGRSGLRLADGDLAVADLLAHRPTQRLPLDTVLLAACSTTVSGTEYDEAFSLATAFLAAGARTVFGSLWEVPDGATAELMFMVHHGLRVDGLAPAEALHRAQLWALDPDRVRPAGMPAGSTGPRSGRPVDRPDDPVAWAAFVHLGA